MVEEMKYVPLGGGLGLVETVEKVAVDDRLTVELPPEALLAEIGEEADPLEAALSDPLDALLREAVDAPLSEAVEALLTEMLDARLMGEELLGLGTLAVEDDRTEAGRELVGVMTELLRVVVVAAEVRRGVVVVVVFEGPRVIVRKPVMVISMGALVMVSRMPFSSGSTIVL